MSIVTIHQPEHLSYLGFFEKVSRCDTLVLLNSVDFEKNYFQNRNRILTRDGVKYITVPVKAGSGKKIYDVEISQNEWSKMRRKIIKTIKASYHKAPYFKCYFNDLVDIYFCNHQTLQELNISLLTYLLRCLGIDVNIVLSQDLPSDGSGSMLIANICKTVCAEKYLSGKTGKDYLNLNHFVGIDVVFQDFKHPIYPQQYGKEFVPNLSVIDALFNLGGEETMNLIKKYNE